MTTHVACDPSKYRPPRAAPDLQVTNSPPSISFSSRYLWLYIIVLKDFIVYILDVFTAITMLTSKQWSNQIFNDCPNSKNCVAVPFDVGRWLFVGCIIFSFLLVRCEVRAGVSLTAQSSPACL